MVDKLVKGSQPKLTFREVVDSAPVGSRVQFRNDKAEVGDVFRNEHTVKVGHRKYVAHGFGTNIHTEDELILSLYGYPDDEDPARLAEARRYVWIKEVDYFLDLVTFTRARKRLMINSLRNATRMMRMIRP
jgi:hypothetical protein